MKRVAMAAVLSLAAALALMAQAPAKQKSDGTAKPQAAAPVVKCKGADGRGCTARQVQTLTDAVFAAKGHHEILASVSSLTLASSDGTLKCDQTDGSACTTAQLDAIKQIAIDQQLFINYNSSKSNSAK
jgi:hypothetical protein